MIVIGVICILMGLFGVWMGNGFYREARTDLPSFKNKEYINQGNLSFTIGIIALLTGVFYIIGNFIII